MEEEKKKAKEVEIKTKSPMWVVVLIGVLVIALACEFVYIKTRNINNVDNINKSITSSDEMYKKYVLNMKNNVSKLQKEKTENILENEIITTYECYATETIMIEQNNKKAIWADVEINSQGEAYIKFEGDENSKLITQYGKKYKLSDNVIQLFQVNSSVQEENCCVFLLKEDGSLVYIEKNDLIFGKVIIKNLNNNHNIKNIVNIQTKMQYNTDNNIIIQAVDIEGNVYRIEEDADGNFVV